ncbi:hypothetical protein V8G54_024910 [Vigna mungo]|uniref:Uncharacterized protein n=1 Tax=Vigna mungo TaxID=3915 RepID=A0AAQ3RQK5_VIGMU
MAVGGARPETLNLSGYGSAGKMGEAPELTSSPIAVRGISLTQEGFGPATSGSNPARPPGQYPASSIKPSDQIVKDSKPVTGNVHFSPSKLVLHKDILLAVQCFLQLLFLYPKETSLLLGLLPLILCRAPLYPILLVLSFRKPSLRVLSFSKSSLLVLNFSKPRQW